MINEIHEKMPSYSRCGRFILAQMKMQNIDIDDLSKKTGLPELYLKKLFLDGRFRSDETLILIADVINVNPDYLICQTGRIPYDIYLEISRDPVRVCDKIRECINIWFRG